MTHLPPAQEIAVAFRGEAKTVKFYPGHEAEWFFAGLTRGGHDALNITDEEAREIEARVRRQS